MGSSRTEAFIRFLNEVKRKRSDKILGGVCSGMAAHSDIPAWAYRVFFLSLLIIGVSALAYVALWLFMPLEDG